MKYCLFLLALISMMACSSSNSEEPQAINFSARIPEVELLESDARLTTANDGTIFLDTVLYSGYLVSYYADSSLKSRRGIYKGRLEGDYISYYPSGQIYSIRPYHLGDKHGEHLGYFDDGKPKFQYLFVNGLSQGTHKDWYPTGNPKKEMNYKDGKELGSQKYWRRDGKMRSNYVVRENGRRYGMLGLKRCAKIDSETGDIDPYKGNVK